MRLAFKIIIGIVIAIVAIFAIMIAVVFVVGSTTMANLEDDFVERAIEIREINDAQIIDDSNLLENTERMVQTDVEKQPLDIMQEKINHCTSLTNDGTLQSPGMVCGIELISELIEFCEKYPNTVLKNSSCPEVLDSIDELRRLESAYNP